MEVINIAKDKEIESIKVINENLVADNRALKVDVRELSEGVKVFKIVSKKTIVQFDNLRVIPFLKS